MKEKIIEILDISISAIQLVNDDDPIGLYGFDRAADAIMTLINQEVEKRIAERNEEIQINDKLRSLIDIVIEERMPRRDELINEAQKVSKIKLSEREKALIRMTYNVLRSRLTQSNNLMPGADRFYRSKWLSVKPNNSEQQMWRDIQDRERDSFCSPAHWSPKNIHSSKTSENT